VYRRLLGTQIVTVVTPSWERLDIAFMPAAATGLLNSGPATVLFDHGQTPTPMSPAAVVVSAEDLVVRAENFIRSVGLMVTDLERGEYTTLRWASEFLIQELVELMFIEAATPRRTLKRIYADLPHKDQRVLETLPLPDGTPDSIVACHLAIAAQFLPRARGLIENAGGRWPAELVDATDRYLRTNVGAGLEHEDD